MSASHAARAACCFLSALALFGATSRALAHTGHSASRQLTVSVLVLTSCSVDSVNAVACSQPLEVERETSAVQTLLVDGRLQQVVFVTFNF